MPEIVHYSEGRLITDGGQNIPDTAVTPTGTSVAAPAAAPIDGQALLADSTKASKTAWATLPGGGDVVSTAAAEISGRYTFTTFPEVHAHSGDATPIFGRSVGDGLTVGKFNATHDGTAGDLFHFTTGVNTGPSRTVTDAVLNSTTTITSATAAFVTGTVGGDQGKTVTGAGIAPGTTIASVTNATTAVLSQAATATASGVSLTIGSGPNSNGAVIAIGIDNGATGITLQNKSVGVGFVLNQLNTVTSSSAYGAQISHFSAVASAWRFLHNSTATVPCVRFDASSAPAGSYIAQFGDNGVGANLLAGRIGADLGTIDWRRTIQTIAPNSSGTPIIRVADEVASNPSETYLAAKTNGELGVRVYRWSGSTTLMYASAWLASSDRFKLQVGNGAQTKGSETMSTLIEVRASATPQMGFFGATPVAQQAAGVDLKTVLVNVGFIAAAGTASPLNLEGGSLTAGGATFSGTVLTNNTVAYQSKDGGGTARGIASITAGGTLNFGDDNLATVNLRGTSISLAPGNVSKLTASLGGVSVADGVPLVFGGTTGSKIGSNATNKIGFYGATAIVQPTGTPAAATDLATAIAAVNSLRTNLLALGLVA